MDSRRVSMHMFEAIDTPTSYLAIDTPTSYLTAEIRPTMTAPYPL